MVEIHAAGLQHLSEAVGIRSAVPVRYPSHVFPNTCFKVSAERGDLHMLPAGPVTTACQRGSCSGSGSVDLVSRMTLRRRPSELHESPSGRLSFVAMAAGVPTRGEMQMTYSGRLPCDLVSKGALVRPDAFHSADV